MTEQADRDEMEAARGKWILDNGGWTAGDYEQAAFADGWNARAASEWVYCKTVEDLPKESGEYLVTMHTRSTDEYVTTLRFYGFWNAIKDEEQRLQILRREYWWPVKYGTQWVIAWMPLPPPAKMEEE